MPGQGGGEDEAAHLPRQPLTWVWGRTATPAISPTPGRTTRARPPPRDGSWRRGSRPSVRRPGTPGLAYDSGKASARSSAISDAAGLPSHRGAALRRGRADGIHPTEGADVLQFGRRPYEFLDQCRVARRPVAAADLRENVAHQRDDGLGRAADGKTVTQ